MICFIKKFRGQLIFTLILCAVILLMPFEDYLERTLDYGDMLWDEDLDSYIDTAGGVVTVSEEAGSVILYSEECYFPAGTYTLSFTADALSADCTVEVYEPYYLNEDNTSGRVIADSVIAEGGTSVNLSFTVEGNAECVSFRLRSEGSFIFRGIYILSNRGLYSDPYIYAGLVILASAVLLAARSRKKIRMETLFILAFAGIWATLPMSFPWLFYVDGHDLQYHFSRLYCLSEDLFSGEFPVLIHSSMFHGFGYMIPTFYPEVFLVPFAVLIHFGLSPIGGYSLMVLCLNLAAAAVGYYSFSRLLCSRKAGALAAVIYTLANYRLANLYTRAALGESLASVFLPLLILGMVQIFYGDRRKWYLAAAAFTCIYQSHLISTELSLGFCVLFGITGIRRLIKDRRRIFSLLKAAGVTLLLNVWSIIPFLDLMRYPLSVLGDDRSLEGYAAYPLQLLDVTVQNASGVAEPTGYVSGEMPYSIGIVIIAGCLLFTVLVLRKKNKIPRKIMTLSGFCLAFGLLSLYASGTLFPWEALQRIGIIDTLFGGIQFAFRFLPFATVFLCVPAAVGIYFFFTGKEARMLMALGTSVLLLYTSGVYFNDYMDGADIYASWSEQTDYVRAADTLYLIGFDSEIHRYSVISTQDTAFNASDGVELTCVSRDGTDASFSYEITENDWTDAYVDVSYFYYPYYKAVDEDGNELETVLDEEFLRLRVIIPEGKTEGTVTVSFVIPAYCRAAEILSLLTAAALTAGRIYKKRKSVPRLYQNENP